MGQHQPSGQNTNRALEDLRVKVRRDEKGNLILGDDTPEEPTKSTTEPPPPPPRDDPRSPSERNTGNYWGG